MPKNSVGLSQVNYDLVKKEAGRRGVSMAAYVNSVLDQIGVADRDEKVILTIPSSLTKKNKEAFCAWLQIRMEALMTIYYPCREKKNATNVATN